MNDELRVDSNTGHIITIIKNIIDIKRRPHDILPLYLSIIPPSCFIKIEKFNIFIIVNNLKNLLKLTSIIVKIIKQIPTICILIFKTLKLLN